MDRPRENAQQIPLAGMLAGVPEPERHRWRSGETYKWDERARFARDVPVKTAADRLVLLMLMAHSDKCGVCFLKLKTLATETRLHVSTVKRSLVRLDKARVIDRDRRRNDDGSPRVTYYRLGIAWARATGAPWG